MQRIILLVIVFVLCAGCAGTAVRGSGRVTTVTKYYRDYHGVHLSGRGIIHLVQSDRYRFSATADDNVLEITDVTINDGILEISYLKNFTSTKMPEFVIEVPEIRSIAVEGRARVLSDTVLSSPVLEIAMNGAAQCRLELAVRECSVRSKGVSSLELSGSGTRLVVQSRGESAVNAFDYSVEEVVLEISGSGKSEVYAERKLDVTLSGAARVLYAGNPRLDTSISGAGTIEAADYTQTQNETPATQHPAGDDADKTADAQEKGAAQ